MMCTIIFDKIAVRDTGLKLEALLLSPILNIGTTCVTFQLLGTVHSSSGLWFMRLKSGAGSEERVLRRRAVMASGPVALCGLMLSTSFFTPWP